MEINVSVIMSVYNTEEQYLRKAIESILNQTYKEFDFIIVLDSPTDGSDKVVYEYKNKDSRIVVLENASNLGLTKSLNYALSRAKGKYIARMDSDDISVPYRLAEQCKFLDEHPEVGVVGGHVYTGIKGTRSMTAWNKDAEITRIHMLFHNAGVPHPTAMFRRLLDGNYEVKYNEQILKSQDYELWSEVVAKTKIVVLDSVFLIYRIHDNQISAMPAAQIEYSTMVIDNQLRNVLDIQDKKTSNQIASVYFGKDGITSEELSHACDLLIEKNNTLNVFNTNKFTKILTEIQFEHAYISMRNESKSKLKMSIHLLKKYGFGVFLLFVKIYMAPKVSHDKLVRKFENDNLEFIRQAI